MLVISVLSKAVRSVQKSFVGRANPVPEMASASTYSHPMKSPRALVRTVLLLFCHSVIPTLQAQKLQFGIGADLLLPQGGFAELVGSAVGPTLGVD